MREREEITGNIFKGVETSHNHDTIFPKKTLFLVKIKISFKKNLLVNLKHINSKKLHSKAQIKGRRRNDEEDITLIISNEN